MKASERIKRGFWRIALLGPAIGAVVALLLLGQAALIAVGLESAAEAPGPLLRALASACLGAIWFGFWLLLCRIAARQDRRDKSNLA